MKMSAKIKGVFLQLARKPWFCVEVRNPAKTVGTRLHVKGKECHESLCSNSCTMTKTRSLMPVVDRLGALAL